MNRFFSVHPHACGEHLIRRSRLSTIAGSSPRLWGTLEIMGRFLLRIQFIPTPVGNTGTIECAVLESSVHPHACGEHPTTFCNHAPINGSSPRLWGTHCHQQPECQDLRFIPTPVGNTRMERRRRTNRTVHPHACGEHTPPHYSDLVSIGSSPRLWGTLLLNNGDGQVERFIPTPVGNTTCRPSVLLYRAVHPHACGEHRTVFCTSYRISGSSPRLWGTPHCSLCLLQFGRFIPTPVGNTFSVVFI